MSLWKKFISTLIGKEKKKESRDGETPIGSCSTSKPRYNIAYLNENQFDAMLKFNRDVFPTGYFPSKEDFIVTTDDK